jgi:2-phospho-L-lactate/phosphoenolpyruvate guanylyltransferase
MSPATSPAASPVVVLIPVKAFSEAKRRLSPSLSREARAVLAQRFANAVVDAAHDLPVAIVCNDPEVVRWAKARRLRVLADHGGGLNSAVTSAVRELHADGVARVIVIHSDLPLAHDIRWLADEEGIALVPDHLFDGTNAISLPLQQEVIDRFTFSYGAGSFAKHEAQARAIATSLGVTLHIVEDVELRHDIDLPSDLDTILTVPQHASPLGK